MLQFRTDLAFEAHSVLKTSSEKNIDGITSFTEEGDIFTVTTVTVETEEAAEKIKKPVGHYVTFRSENIKKGLFTRELSEAFSSELKKLITKKKAKTFLVACLGNSRVSADALGPKVSEQLIITRHMIAERRFSDALKSVCALAPGVLGITGIETAEIFSCIVDKTKPDIIIAVDALAAADIKNLGTTLQLSDTGINPGSGVHNRRNALNEHTLGVPVIAVGMPTVCDFPSAAYYHFSQSNNINERNFYHDQSPFNKKTDLIVTPKSIDALINRAALVISRGINLALQPSLSYDDVTDCTS